MDELVLKIFTARFDDDTEGLMNILFFVVLAVFWIVGGIIKATSQKNKDKQKQQPPRKPVRKISKTDRTRVSTLPERPSRTPQVRPQIRPRPSRPSERDKALQAKIVEASEKMKSAPAKPYEEPVHQGISEFASKPLVELDSLRLERLQREAELVEELPEIDLNYEDPEELVKAILHVEILGPPVSLRDLSHQNAGF